jgi:hypothetical protein
VEKVYPPKYNADANARDAHKDASSSSTLDDDPPHVIGGDLKVPAKDALANDNPTLYYYWVHLTELERDKSHEKGKSSTKITDADKRLVGSLIEVQCGMMRFFGFPAVLNLTYLAYCYLFLVATACHSPSRSSVASLGTVWIVRQPSPRHGLSKQTLLNDMGSIPSCLKKLDKALKLSKEVKLIKGKRHGKTKRDLQIRSRKR